jgi:hypothetical protein
LTEAQAAADVVQIRTNGTATESGVVTVTGADGAADVITAFNFADDTIQIVASGVVNFVHTTHTKLGTGTADTVASTAGAATASELNTSTVAVDITSAAAADAVSLGAGDIAFTLSSANNAGVALTATTASTTGTLTEALVQSRMQYNLTGTAAANTITTGALADTITGGAGADDITGGAGADVIVMAAAASVARTAETITAASLANGETITFGNGVDIIRGFVSGTDKLDVTTANAVTTFAAGADVQGLTANGNFAIRGNFNAATGAFTVAAAGADTLVLTNAVNADLDAAGQTGFVVLIGTTSVANGDFI